MDQGFLNKGANVKKSSEGNDANLGSLLQDLEKKVGSKECTADEEACGPTNESQVAGSERPDGVNSALNGNNKSYEHVGSGSVPKVDSSTSFANVVNATRIVPKVNFRALVNEDCLDNHDTLLPMAAVNKILSRYDNTLVGYFLGKTIAFPLVHNYVTNTWGKFGLQKLMKNSDGVFLFKFANKEGLARVLERGPWTIRNSPIILNKWTHTLSFNRSEVIKVPVWIKMHKVPLVTYSEDGLSLIATQVGKPIMLDTFTSSMCVESWGRIGFARALVELSADAELKSHVTMAIPNEEGIGFTTAIINVEYEWKPPHCGECKTFGHSLIECPNHVKEVVRGNTNVAAKASESSHTLEKTDDGFIEVTNRKNKGKNVAAPSRPIGGVKLNKPIPKFWRPVPKKSAATKEKLSNEASTSGKTIATSNPFDALDISDTDDNGTTCAINVPSNDRAEVGSIKDTKVAEHVVSSSKSVKGSTTPIVEKIGKIEKLIIEGKVTLVDDDGKPLKKVDSSNKVGNPFSKVGDVVVSDSDDDEVFDDPFGTLYPKSSGNEKSLYEQWKADTGDDNNYNDDDFDLTPAQLKAVGMQDFWLK